MVKYILLVDIDDNGKRYPELFRGIFDTWIEADTCGKYLVSKSARYLALKQEYLKNISYESVEEAIDDTDLNWYFNHSNDTWVVSYKIVEISA